MVYQHHRHNMHALVPVGDFLLHAAGWTGRPPTAFLSVFDGYSPVSSVVCPEIAPALDALRKDDDARALAPLGWRSRGRARPASRAEVPEVGEYIDSVHFRLLEGFDLPNPTIGERPELLVGRLQTALDVDAGRRAADAPTPRPPRSAPRCRRSTVPAFDDLLAEARLVYRLRDERGIYSEIAAVGLLRLALLELGRRLRSAVGVEVADDVLEVSADELAGPVRRRRRPHRRGAPRASGRPRGAHPARERPGTSARRRPLRLRSTCSRRRWHG